MAKFLQKAIKRPGRLTRAAAAAGVSKKQMADKWSHSSDPSKRGAGILGKRLMGGEFRKKGGDSHLESPYSVVGGDIRSRVGVAMPSLDPRIQVGKAFDSCKNGNKLGPAGGERMPRGRAMAKVQPEVEANQGNTMGPRGDAKHVLASEGEYA